MKIEYVNVKDIIPYENNAKKHPEYQIEQIIRSIEEFGFNDPIAIDENNVVIEGHGRLMAVKKLKYKEIQCIRLEHLSPEQKKAYIIAHNKLTMNTGFDLETLAKEMRELDVQNFDLDVLGFDSDELEDILGYAQTAEDVYEDDYNPDEYQPPEPLSKEGDLWILGNHKLYVGDSTKPEAYEALLQGESVDLVVTDPPYNVDYGSKADAINKYGYNFSDRRIMNDVMDNIQFQAFLTDAFEHMAKALKPGGAFYIWHASITQLQFEIALRENELAPRQQVIWYKNAIVLGRQDYQWIHEPCLYGWKEGAAHYFRDDRTQTTVQELEQMEISQMKKEEMADILYRIQNEIPQTIIKENKPSRSVEHPTMKPIKLLAHLISNSSKPGELVLDNFAGSGSTLITAEQLGRRSVNIELDPKYADVIVQRYIKHTQNEEEVQLIRNGQKYPLTELAEFVTSETEGVA
jgi:DNA modification methylase